MHSHEGHNTVTVRQLIDVLEDVAARHGDDLTVVTSRDDEGNEFRPMWHAIGISETYLQFDEWWAEQVEDEETGEWRESPVNCVIIWP